ncbi:sex determination protein tasselseed-2 isoform X2 [Arachis stenosperma]|uniref:sex determination protein tasselseed-2 isoform X2 n=1 Tax=Arachis stenosperma TaxID=217475 RepID=UPI0025AB6FE4|nr:sex determination protein tasselseed-2 isoform X2 [Arachis stenosperma]
MLRIGLSENGSYSRALFGESFHRLLSTHTGRKLQDKVALITGAASGIGKATATKFINNGARVIIADIQQKLGQETANELGPNASFITWIACRTPPSIVDLDMTVFDKVMKINVGGLVAGIKHAARVMIPHGTGSILCTASITGVMGGMSQHTYSISKCAVIGTVKSMASELCRHGIRVNCISPFAIPTTFVMEEMSLLYPNVDAQRHMEIVHNAGVLKGANCEPNDIANAALFLVSDDAKYVSGHNLVVDGGFTSFKNLDFPAPNQVQ